jgi:protein SCO1/2
MRRVGPGPRAAITIVLILAGATAGMLLAGGRAETAAPGLRANLLPGDVDAAPAPAIALRDQRGRRIDSDRLRGRPYLVTFLYTHCVDVCPVIGSEIADALDRLGSRAAGVAVLAVSVDPRGDTPAAARDWIEQRRLPAQFHFLLGTRRQLSPVWRAWYLPAHVDPRTHDAGVWLVDARGRLRGRWAGAEPIPPADIAHDLSVLLGEADQRARISSTSSAS